MDFFTKERMICGLTFLKNLSLEECSLRPASQRGTSLLETIIALSILIMSSFAGIQTFSTSSDQMRRQESLLSVNDSLMTLSSAAVSLPALLVSSSVNNGLGDCLKIDGVICSDQPSFRPLRLLDPSNKELVANGEEFLRYDGKPCDRKYNKDPSCALRRTISYKAYCSGINTPGSGCDIASSIIIKFELTPYLHGSESEKNALPFYEKNGVMPFSPIHLVKDVSISIYDFLANLDGKKCPIDQAFTFDVLNHVNTHLRNAASVGYDAQAIAPLPYGYHQRLQGISWNGQLVCQQTGAQAGSSNPGPRGIEGRRGFRGPSGPKGPRGGPEPNCTIP